MGMQYSQVNYVRTDGVYHTDDDWKELEMNLGMTQEQADAPFWRGTNQASQLAGNAELWSDGHLCGFGTRLSIWK